MNKKKNKKMILNIIMILTFFIIMFNMKTYVLAVGEKIEIKDGGEIITQSEGNLTTPKVLNVNIMKEKKLTLNTIGLDKTKLEYNIEEKEGKFSKSVEESLERVIEIFRYLVKLYQEALDATDEEGDDVTNDIFVGAKADLEKNIWMLTAEIGQVPGL